MLKIEKATKKKSKLRLALFGPSGSGKTFTALRIATGMGGRIVVGDTERGSASLYSDKFEFDVAELEQKSIAELIEFIGMAKDAKYDVLIIDSGSHSWQELLEELEKLAKAKYSGNFWSAWSDGTPKQRKLIDAILNYPGHIIFTMRSKTEWEISKDEKTGKSKPIRIGLTPEQGKGIEYEFTMLMEMNTEHYATIIKDRTGKFQDAMIEKPGEEFGKQLIDWLAQGADDLKMEQATKDEIAELKTLATKVKAELFDSRKKAIASVITNGCSKKVYMDCLIELQDLEKTVDHKAKMAAQQKAEQEKAEQEKAEQEKMEREKVGNNGNGKTPEEIVKEHEAKAPAEKVQLDLLLLLIERLPDDLQTPYKAKRQLIKTMAEASALIMEIDAIIKNPQPVSETGEPQLEDALNG